MVYMTVLIFYFFYGLKDLTNALCKVVCDYTWVVMYSSCMNGLNVVATKQACVYVVVQFYPWFKFSFFSNSLSCYYHTLPYPKTKEKKI